MPRPTTPSVADVLDALRERVEASGRTQVEIAQALDPPMSKQQVHQLMTGANADIQLSTLLRFVRALGLRLRDLDPR